MTASKIDATIAGVCPEGWHLADAHHGAGMWWVWLDNGVGSVMGKARTFGKALMNAAGKAGK